MTRRHEIDLEFEEDLQMRREETAHMIQRDVKDCWEKREKTSITVKLVDPEKGVADKEKIRSRLVTRNFRLKGESSREVLFATSPAALKGYACRTFARPRITDTRGR